MSKNKDIKVFYTPEDFINNHTITFVQGLKIFFNIDPKTKTRKAHYDSDTKIYKLEINFDEKENTEPLNTVIVNKDMTN